MAIKHLIQLQEFLSAQDTGVSTRYIQGKINRDWYSLLEDLQYLELRGDIYSIEDTNGVKLWYSTEIEEKKK